MLKIYIPICFYYFKYAIAFLTIIQIFTFQYVSIISNSMQETAYGWNRIYIPICFYYFIIPMQFSDVKTIHLHSNMFLLFDVYRINRVIRTEFTFQYVSIISEQTRKLNTEHFLFTFQYVLLFPNIHLPFLIFI